MGADDSETPTRSPPAAGDDERIFHYPGHLFLGDAARAIFGVLTGFAFVSFSDPGSLVWWFALALGLLAVAYGLRAVIRMRTRLSLTHDGVITRLLFKDGANRWALKMGEVSWSQMHDFSVRNYRPRSFNTPLWVELVVTGSPGRWVRGRVEVDHRLEGFLEILEVAWGEARQRRIPFDRTTLANLTALSMHGHIAAIRPVPPPSPTEKGNGDKSRKDDEDTSDPAGKDPEDRVR